jgi:hypothetical protein
MVMLGALKGKLAEDMPMPVEDEASAADGAEDMAEAEAEVPAPVDLSSVSDDQLLEEVRARNLV